MFSFLSSRKRKRRQEDFNRGWNSCLNELLELLEKHQWTVEEEDPQEIFCDVCGQGLMRALDDMHKKVRHEA